ncbi:hypothetical protein [Proteus phage vB_PmiP_RS51pmB]|nr:hypothetical protein [Proteus phage vB_PmiP_RS51pmB]
MSKDEYRKAFKDSGLKASSWCKFLGISQYQHRNYQNGRTVVPERVEFKATILSSIKLSIDWSKE